MFRNISNMFRAMSRKLVQPDPKPKPSILDVLDSRGTVPLDDDGPVFIPSVHVMDHASVAAYYARITEVQKRSDWS